MNFRLLNLYLLIFWLFIALTLLFRRQLFPEDMQNPARDQQFDMLAYVAFGLAAWNGVRWWVIRGKLRRRSMADSIYAQHIGPAVHKDPPPVTDPQFQFDKPGVAVPPPPPPNGERHGQAE